MAEELNSRSDIHSPADLLRIAEELYACGNPDYMRPVVLEAMTCLEAYVREVIFPALKSKIDPLLVKWLEDKTRMDFDSRLSIITPVALGHPIDKASALWGAYKKAREVRHKVTHSGRRVSAPEARFVLDTVHDWLAYLVSSVEVELTLRLLKREVETRHIHVADQESAVRLVQTFFGEKHDATPVTFERPKAFDVAVGPDVVLVFGKYKIAINAKIAPQRWTDSVVGGEKRNEASAKQPTEQYYVPSSFTHAAVVLFNRGAWVEEERAVRKTQDDRMLTVIINCGRQSGQQRPAAYRR